MHVSINIDSLFWYAQKPENTGSNASYTEHVQDEELLERDEEEDELIASALSTTSARVEAS